jgi:hypothetical protein
METARAYAQEKLQPRILEAYGEERTDRAISTAMGELGLPGLPLPPVGFVPRQSTRTESAWETRSCSSCAHRL